MAPAHFPYAISLYTQMGSMLSEYFKSQCHFPHSATTSSRFISVSTYLKRHQTTIENNSWEFTQLSPLNHDLNQTFHYNEINDAEEFFGRNIFSPGNANFSITTIKETLLKYAEPTILDLRHITESDLKMMVIEEVNKKVHWTTL